MGNPTSSVDVEVLLSPIVDGVRKLNSIINIYKEKDKPNCLVKPRKRLRRSIWLQLHEKIRSWNGCWKRTEGLWIIPLETRK